MLSLVQSLENLNHVYEDDYYWYLRSPEFRRVFLVPLGIIVDGLGLPCLDVGCGEGQLGDHVSKVCYSGFDGSDVAIQRARENLPVADLRVGRIESPPDFDGDFGTVVFGGLFQVLVAQEQQVEFLEIYRERYRAVNFVVYDLFSLDTSRIDESYSLMMHYEARADMALTPAVKLHRKIRVYRAKEGDR